MQNPKLFQKRSLRQKQQVLLHTVDAPLRSLDKRRDGMRSLFWLRLQMRSIYRLRLAARRAKNGRLFAKRSLATRKNSL
jgi:hypothetical protein